MPTNEAYPALPKALQAVVDAGNSAQQAHMEAMERQAQPPDAEEVTPEQSPEEGQDPTVSETPEVNADAKPNEPVTDKSSADEDPNSETWRHRYQTLQGMFRDLKIKSASLEQDKSAMERELSRVQHDLDTAKAQVQEASRAAKSESQEAVPDLNLEELGEYGDTVRRLGEQTIAQAKQIEALKAAINGMREQSSEDDQKANSGEQPPKDDPQRYAKFLSVLGSMVENYAEINQDPSFLKYLTSGDGRRMASLRDYESKGDAVSVAMIFNDFIGMREAMRTFDDTTSKVREISAEVQRQVQPAKSHGGDTPKGKRTYTIQEVKDFYDIRNAPRWVGREAEKASMKTDIDLAQAEGRIIG